MEHSVKPGHVHRMLFSIASALDFLHVPVSTNYDQSCKPGIAHRDLKTRNILLKRDGSCVLADFGLAVRTQDFETTKPAIKSLVGTKRYMAPEVLSGDISTRELTPFCKADIYSFGLVMWEVLRRAETDGVLFGSLFAFVLFASLSCVSTLFCLFVCLFVCLVFLYTLFCLFVLCFDSGLFVCLFVCLSVLCFNSGLFVCLMFRLWFVCLFVCLSYVSTLVCLFVCLSYVSTLVCLFVCLFVLCFDSVVLVCHNCCTWDLRKGLEQSIIFELKVPKESPLSVATFRLQFK